MSTSEFMAYPFLRPDAQFQPELPFAAAQRGFTCWSRAATQVMSGLMSASMAQLDLARSVYAAAPVDTAATLPNHGMHAAGLEWVRTAHSRFDAAVKGYRQINDELMATLFSAAETVMDVVPDEMPGQVSTTMTQAAAPKRAVPAA